MNKTLELTNNEQELLSLLLDAAQRGLSCLSLSEQLDLEEDDTANEARLLEALNTLTAKAG